MHLITTGKTVLLIGHYCMSQAENLVRTTTSLKKTGLVLTHSPFVSSLNATYTKLIVYGFHTRIYHPSCESVQVSIHANPRGSLCHPRLIPVVLFASFLKLRRCS